MTEYFYTFGVCPEDTGEGYLYTEFRVVQLVNGLISGIVYCQKLQNPVRIPDNFDKATSVKECLDCFNLVM